MNYNSIFKNELYEFINHKKALGYKYNCISIINKFDKFCVDLKTKEISQELFELWISKKDNESNNMQVKKYSFIKNFTNYLIVNGYDNIYYNNDYKIKNNSKFVPYIFSDDEIFIIFQNLKKFEIKTYDGNDKDNFMLLFTILYCCGLRISEALNIKMSDINFDNKTIMILHSKNQRSRIIAITDNLIDEIKKFVEKNNISKEHYLFHNKYNNKYQYSKVNDIWLKLLNNCGFDNSNHKYRIHNLRHGFAINCLNQLENKGYDIYTSLPLVSKYLGHKSIKATEYYLRLTKNYSNKILDSVDKYIGKILENDYE